MSEIPTGMPIGDRVIQHYPPEDEWRGKFMVDRITAPERSDPWAFIWQEGNVPLKYDNPHMTEVEESVLKRFFTIELQQLGRDGAFRPKNETELEGFYATLRTSYKDADWENLQTKARQLSDSIAKQLVELQQQTTADLGKDLGMFGRRGNAGLSVDMDEKFIELYEEVRTQTVKTREQIEVVLNRALALTNEDVDAIFGIIQNAEWRTLPDASKRFITRKYSQWKREFIEGGIERDWGHRARMIIRDRAPSEVRTGSSRRVEDELRKIYKAHEDLQNTPATEAEKIAALKQIISNAQKECFKYLSALTQTYVMSTEWRFEPLPVGRVQAENAAWEIISEYDKSRDADGNINPGVLEINATPDAGSWESADVIGKVVFHKAVARNALKRLTDVREIPPPPGSPAGTPPTQYEFGREEFINHYATSPEFRDPATGQRLRLVDPMTRREIIHPEEQIRLELTEEQRLLEETRRSLREVQQQIDTRVRQFGSTHARAVEAGQTRTEIRDVALAAAGAGRGGGGGNNQNQMNAQLAAGQRVATARERLQVLHAETVVLERQRRELETQQLDHERNIARLRGARPTIAQMARYRVAVRRAQEIEYSGLVEKLSRYVNQTGHGEHLVRMSPVRLPVLSAPEIELVARLTGVGMIHTHDDKTGEPTGTIGLACPPFWTGDVPRQRRRPDGSYEDIPGQVFEGDFAAISVWGATPETPGRASPTALKQILENPGRHPLARQIVEPVVDPTTHIAHAKNKVVLIHGFAVSPDPGGGLSYRLKRDKVKELKKEPAVHGDPNILQAEWLNSINIGRKIGAYPEEVAEHQMTDMARSLLMRHKYFDPSLGWTYKKVFVASEDPDNLSTNLLDMTMAGKPLVSASRKEKPFNDQIDTTNEHAFTIVDDKRRSLPIAHLKRDMDVAKLPGAPNNFVEGYQRAIVQRLELYKHHAKLGGEPIAHVPYAPKKKIREVGAAVMAYLDYIEELEAEVEGIVATRLPAIEKVQKLVEFHDERFAHLIHDIVDEHGKFVAAENPYLARPIQERVTKHGLYGSAMRKKMMGYVETELNDSATEIQKEIDFEEFIDSAVTYGEDIFEKEMLGMQELGMLPGDENGEEHEDARRELSEITAAKYVDSMMLPAMQMFQEMAAVVEGSDMALTARAWIPHFKGAIQMSDLMQELRNLSANFGGVLGGNMGLRPIPKEFIERLKRFKRVGELEFYFASRITQYIETGNQRALQQIIDSAVAPTDRAREIEAEMDDETRTLKTLYEVIRAIMIAETADFFDRDVHNAPIDDQVLARKEKGRDIRWLKNRKIVRATIPDNHFVDPDLQLRFNHRPGTPVHPTTVRFDPTTGTLPRSQMRHVPANLIRLVRAGLDKDRRWTKAHSRALVHRLNENVPPLGEDT